MSIWQKAYETFENHAHLVGLEEEGRQTLTPVGHIVQKAQIELTINVDGTFRSAVAVDKNDCKTIIPATENSAARTQQPVPHPLCDQLLYLMPGGGKPYEDYLTQLSAWADSPFSTPKVTAVLTYVRSGTILQDLQGESLLALTEAGELAPGKVAGADYRKCMIRWRVLNAGETTACWKDPELFAAYQGFLTGSTREKNRGFCMISGEEDSIAASHPKGTLATDYGAKLISANDSTGFTYRGRFTAAEQAASIGFTASQKVHSALQWLAANQRVRVVKGGRTFLCWNPKGKPVFQPFDPFASEDEQPPAEPSDYQKQLERTLKGLRYDLPDEEDVVIAALEAATTGRLSITCYSEMKASDYHQRLHNWYCTCCMQNGWGEIRSPSLETIVKCAFGTERKRGGKHRAGGG